MSKGKVLPFTGNWHLELAPKPDKARAALREIEGRDLAKAIAPRQKTPAVGWSDPSEQLFTVDELAKHFKVQVGAIYKEVRAGRLIPERFGRMLRFSRAEIDRYKTAQLQKRHG